MYERMGSFLGVAMVLTLVFGGAAASAQDSAIGAGPLLAASNGNPLREASCDVYVGGASSRSFTVAITASPPPMGGAATVIAQQFFANVPPGQTRTLTTASPLVPNLGPIFCVVECGGVIPSNLFATLSTLELFDDSIETVVGASGNTSIPNGG